MGNEAAKPGTMVKTAIVLLKVYRLVISPFFSALGINCRFYPTCSQYAMDAFRLYGFRRGLIKTVCRLGKCHPFHPGGYDPA